MDIIISHIIIHIEAEVPPGPIEDEDIATTDTVEIMDAPTVEETTTEQKIVFTVIIVNIMVMKYHAAILNKMMREKHKQIMKKKTDM